jgi:hypothetical protein
VHVLKLARWLAIDCMVTKFCTSWKYTRSGELVVAECRHNNEHHHTNDDHDYGHHHDEEYLIPKQWVVDLWPWSGLLVTFQHRAVAVLWAGEVEVAISEVSKAFDDNRGELKIEGKVHDTFLLLRARKVDGERCGGCVCVCVCVREREYITVIPRHRRTTAMYM